MSLTDELTFALDVLTAALVVITGFYAWATLKILRANEAVVALMRADQAAQNRPYIIVATDVRGPQFLFLTIKNAGRTPARNLKLSLDRPVPTWGDPNADLGASATFRQPMKSLPPGVEHAFLLGIGRDLSGGEDTLLNSCFTVTAEYEVEGGRAVEHTPIDLRPYKGASMSRDPVVGQLERMERGIEKIAKAVDHAANSNVQVAYALRGIRR